MCIACVFRWYKVHRALVINNWRSYIHRDELLCGLYRVFLLRVDLGLLRSDHSESQQSYSSDSHTAGLINNLCRCILCTRSSIQNSRVLITVWGSKQWGRYERQVVNVKQDVANVELKVSVARSGERWVITSHINWWKTDAAESWRHLADVWPAICCWSQHDDDDDEWPWNSHRQRPCNIISIYGLYFYGHRCICVLS